MRKLEEAWASQRKYEKVLENLKSQKTSMNKFDKICDPADRAGPAPRPSGKRSEKARGSTNEYEEVRESMRKSVKVCTSQRKYEHKLEKVKNVRKV